MRNTVFLLILISYVGSVMAIEEPDYRLIKQDGHFELRAYEPMIIAETLVVGDLSEASNTGFRRIADYIFGNNTSSRKDANENSAKAIMAAPVNIEVPAGVELSPESQTAPVSVKISMTAPVGIEANPLIQSTSVTVVDETDNSQWRVSFVMPKKYTMETLPSPNNDKVALKEIPEQKKAVIRFSGLAGEGKVTRKTAALFAWMDEQNLVITGQPQLARYNPPWTLPFLRRNEILITYISHK